MPEGRDENRLTTADLLVERLQAAVEAAEQAHFVAARCPDGITLGLAGSALNRLADALVRAKDAARVAQEGR